MNSSAGNFGGSLMEQARQAEAFVQSNMRRGMRIAGLAREETTEYPLAVVREAIVNAIAHRDYSVRGEGIRLLMFSDRLQIYSPGRLPGHVTLQNLVDERYSRNEAIVAVLTDFGYIERLGYGIDRMMAAMSAAGLPEPVFEETAAGFQVTLFSAGTALVSAPSRRAALGPRLSQRAPGEGLGLCADQRAHRQQRLPNPGPRRQPRNHPPGSGGFGGKEFIVENWGQTGHVLYFEMKREA